VNPKTLALQIIKELRACTDRVRQEATQNYFPSRQENLGVYAQDMRRIVREQRKPLKAEPAKAIIELAHAIIAHNTMEGRQAAYEILAGHKAAFASLGIKQIEALGKGIDNWASVDGFGCWISGPCWRLGQVKDGDIHRWARNNDPWWRRAALVSTVPLNTPSKGGKGDSKRTLHVCNMLAQDDHIMVHKALSWALRELVRWDKPAVKRFLESHGLPALVRREVNSKLTTGRKNG
jgi:3-methyladenine DNA glycosylase AlkD